MSVEGEHPLSGKLNLCKSRKANFPPRLAWRHGIGIPPVACGRCAGGGGKPAAPGKLRLRFRLRTRLRREYLLFSDRAFERSWEIIIPADYFAPDEIPILY